MKQLELLTIISIMAMRLIQPFAICNYLEASNFGAALGGRTFGRGTSLTAASGRLFFSTLNYNVKLEIGE